MTEKILNYIKDMKPQMINTLTELISFDSHRRDPEDGAPFGIPAKKCLERALEICESFGFEVKNVDNYAGRARLGDDPELGILAHLDVVPAGSGWTKKPFEATVEGDRLYGRGAMDDKGPAVSVMYAMKAIKDLGIPLKRGVELILGTDEECGSSDIDYYMSKEKLPGKVFTPDADYPVINIEKGRICAKFSAKCRSSKLVEFHGGKTVNAVPALANAVVKGISASEIKTAAEESDCTVKFDIKEDGEKIIITANGTPAHASLPDLGDNALTGLVRLLSALPLDEPAKAMISGIDGTFPYRETDGKSAGIDARDDESGSLTLALSILDFDGEKMSGAMDIRFPVCESVENISKKLEKKLSEIGFAADISGVEPHCVPSGSEFVRTLLAVYHDISGKPGEAIAIGGGTYVHGIPGGVAFGCETGEDNRIHAADEFIRTDALVENAVMFAEAIMRVCG